MAHVSPPGGARDGSGRPHERGQLILITALSLAILFVSLALILNTAIYTENLATRSSDIGGGTDAVRYHDAARDGVGGLVEYANRHNNSTEAHLASNLTAGIADFGNDTGRQFAMSDRAVDTAYVSHTDGSRIAQADASRNFTNASGAANWQVAGSVSSVRALRFHVSNDLLLGTISDGFRVVVFDGSSYWNLTVYRPSLSTDLEVIVDGPTVTDNCAVTADQAWINVSEETFGGEDCEVLGSFADGLSAPYSIAFENSDDVNGTYAMVVDDTAPATSPSPHLNAPGGGQPFASHAIYAATVDVTYETPRLSYRTTVRVAPAEVDR